jgi:hypothetical protein
MMIVVRTSEGPMNLVVDKIGLALDVDASSFELPTETLKPSVHAMTTHVCKLEENLLLVLDTEKAIQLPCAGGEKNGGARKRLNSAIETGKSEYSATTVRIGTERFRSYSFWSDRRRD